MGYPLSPFDKSFDANKIFEGCFNSVDKEDIQHLLSWLCTSPEITYYKVNTLTATTEEVIYYLKKHLEKIADNRTIPLIKIHSYFSDTIVVYKWMKAEQDLNCKEKSVIVDASCGASVLRGAHVFAPGVMGMETGTLNGETVSIYADISKKCKRGFQKVFECSNKVFVGNGIVKMTRTELFGHQLTPKGIAVEVIDAASGCPSIGESCFPVGTVLLQNISSILCVGILDPQPDDIILDMCASPGHKTVHIAALMKNKGTLVAIDKTPSKIRKLQAQCTRFCANVHIFQADSTKIISNENYEDKDAHPRNGPPFRIGIFDRILLDAPCSGLGQRPQLKNNITEKILQSYIPLQRKLFHSAVPLLKCNGILVYSTCTITVLENEKMVAWALKTFKCLQLIRTEPILGGAGMSNCGLNSEDHHYVQRFGPDQSADSLGFFIAKFIKVL